MKTKIAIVLVLNAGVAMPVIAGDIYRWTDPKTGQITTSPSPPPYPIKDTRTSGGLPNGNLINVILDTQSPEIKAIIEKKNTEEAEQRRIAEQKQWEKDKIEKEQKQITEKKEKEEQQAHPLLPPKESDQLEKWIRIETSLPKDVQNKRIEERLELDREKAKTDPEAIKKNAQIDSLKTGNGFKIGMSEIDLITLWGEPTKINTSIGPHGVNKQMIYDDPCKTLGMGHECLYKSRIIYSENGVITFLQY
ncbi:MAG: hypothetical protein LAE24_05060 [Candidatus Contendobacter sp.]|nr:hypothetical protein [Candidatus Contendobacter sp.]